MENKNWPDSVRLHMIEKSEFYPGDERVYQYGFYDGYQYALQKAEPEINLREELIPTMKMVVDKCNKDIEMYSYPEELQSKLMNRKDLQEAAYTNGFMNCYYWIKKQGEL